jgi:uncharacterized membrane protein
MKKKLLFLSLMTLVLMTLLWSCNPMYDPTTDEQYDNSEDFYEEDMKRDYEVIKAQVLRIDKDDTKEVRPDVDVESDRRVQFLYVRLLEGDHKGEEYTLRNTIEMINPYRLIFKEGEKLYLYVFENENGEVGNIHIYEKIRDVSIYWLIIAFVVLLIAFGKMKGLKTVITLAITIFLIGFVLLPLILAGYNPLLVTLGIVILITTISLIIISGWNKKTRTAIMGTFAGVVVAALVASFVGYFAYLTGLGDEHSVMLARIPKYRHLNYHSILLSGIIIGALGAVMDVALSIASAMWEIEENSPKIRSKSLIQSGMNIGKDMMGSMANTLILAYVGSSIQLILLFISYDISLVEILNMDMIASEVVKAVAGSIGLVACIPLTTWIGGTIGRKNFRASHKSK